uniref:N(6)-L-threonylcarbamoyladenine synthase n=1 Tax=Periophthalmus magnuspinnatus TaxID=409849 RepID=A0A3B4AEN7_9GOBI
RCKMSVYKCNFFNPSKGSVMFSSAFPRLGVLGRGCLRRQSRAKASSLVLGIETSCDDTGAAVMDLNGTVLGESLHSQKEVHLRTGGIIPTVAQRLHREHIERVVNEALALGGVSPHQLSAVATTVKPGLALSLGIGLEFSLKFVKLHRKPFIPIHHMEAHALTVRLKEQVTRQNQTLIDTETSIETRHSIHNNSQDRNEPFLNMFRMMSLKYKTHGHKYKTHGHKYHPHRALSRIREAAQETVHPHSPHGSPRTDREAEGAGDTAKSDANRY